MARKQRGKGPGQGGQPPQNPPQAGGGGWAPLRDAIRRDVEQAVSALAFAERLHQKMDTQRRAFLDFPRVMEQVRSGAMERLTASLSRLYEGGQGFDLQRFLRDLPLALAQLAAADKAGDPAIRKSGDPGSATATATAAVSVPPAVEAKAPEAIEAAAEQPGSPDPRISGQPDPRISGQPVSPRLELRSKLLTAAPNLAKAAASYRRNVATIRRASLPRRSPGPWRADREVLEEAHRAVEFVQKLYDAYAEAWADQPLSPNLLEQTSDELDRFLAWTQLDRYVELAVLASTNAPRPPKPGQQVFSAPRETPPAEELKAQEAKPVEAKPVEAKPEEPKPEEAKPAEPAPIPPAAEPEPGRA